MSFEIITDTTCDLTIEILNANNVKSAPLGVTMGGQFYNHLSDYSELPLDEFYKRLRAGEKSSTSAVNIDRWCEDMEKCLQNSKELLVVGFSSALSSTYQYAVAAADEMMEKHSCKIVVIDTLCASAGEGLLVLEAARLRAEGKNIDETADAIRAMAKKVEHWFTVDDLHHLKRGGRIPAVTAIVGTALSVKPLLKVDNTGALVSVGKARGRKKAVQYLLDKVKSADIADNTAIYIAHSDCIDEANALKAEIEAAVPNKNVEVTFCGPIIGTHTGANMIGIFYVSK